MELRRLRKIATRSLVAWLTGDRRRLLREKRRLVFLLAEREVDALTFRSNGTTWTVPAADDAVARKVFVDGIHQGREIHSLLAWLSRYGYLGDEKSTIVEVGANLGTTTVPFAKQTGKHVLAVEPMPENFEFLLRNVSDNGLDERVTCIQAAVSPASRELTMVSNPSGGMSEVKAEGENQGYGKPPEESRLVRVPSLSLDEALRSHGIAPQDVAFVWSDTQGYERQVIESGASLWFARVPLYLELWPDGLRVHGGVESFVETVQMYFGALILRNELMAQGTSAPRRPMSELCSVIDALEHRHTDALLIAR
jgi:FkbM family methyltransferase